MPEKNKARGRLEINQFHGPGIVIGCSCTSTNSNCMKYHKNDSQYFFIDKDASKSPDLVGDVTKIPQETRDLLKNRFELTLVECLPCFAYNKWDSSLNGVQGFSNIWDMTADNGFIIIVGCPPYQSTRHSIYNRALNYIESDVTNNIVIIPKNQNATIYDVINQLKRHDLKHGLYRPNIIRNFDALKFFELPFDSLTYGPVISSDLNGESIVNLSHQINRARTHAEYLLKCGAETKGQILLSVITMLQQEVDKFEQLTLQEKRVKFPHFNRACRNILCRQEIVAELSTHRAFWKIIIANILVGLTGVGAALLAVHYAKHRCLLFSTTKSMQIISNTEAALSNLQCK